VESSRSSAPRPARAGAAPKKRFGFEEPRVFTPPLRKLTPKTTAGFALIEFASVILGMDLLPWQKWLAIHALELLPDGTFRFRTVVLLVARQNGKSTFLQVLALFFMYVRGVHLVIGTAQNLDIAEEVWQGAVDIAEDVPELASEIERVVKTNGKKSLELSQGERYKVQAANRRGGRGLSGDLVLMDELREHQSWDAWGAVTKTTLARAHAQVWAASNAGDAASIVLRFLRKLAHVALGDPDGLQDVVDVAPDDADVAEVLEDDDSLGIFEWSAPPGCALDDADGISQANPSQGYTITDRAINGARRTDPEWVYRTEVLCQWSDGSLEGPFPPGSWEAGIDKDSRIVDDKVVACIDVSFDRSRAHIVFAGHRADGLPHVEVVASRAGTEWVLPWLQDRKRVDLIAAVTGQTRGAPVSGLLPELLEAGVPIVDWQGSDLGGSSGIFYDLVRANGIRHLAQPVLDVAAATAVTRPSGDGWLWDRRHSSTDIAPLVAATGVVCLLAGTTEKPFVSKYESNDLAVV